MTSELSPDLRAAAAAIAAAVSRLAVFAAPTAGALDAERRECAAFLIELQRMGARTEYLGELEEAFFQLLRKPSTGGWEIESPFRPESGAIDRERVDDAIRTGLPDERGLSPEVYAWLDVANRAQWKDGIHAGVGLTEAAGPTIGQILRGAAFVELAVSAGVSQDNRPALRRLVAQEVTRLPGSAADAIPAAVRRQLGVSEVVMAKHAPVEAYSVQPGAPSTTGARVRAQLGISSETWARFGGG